MTAQEMLLQEAKQDRIVARAEAMLADLLGRLSAREALVALTGSEAVAELLADAEHGD